MNLTIDKIYFKNGYPIKKCVVCGIKFATRKRPGQGRRSTKLRPYKSVTCSRKCSRDRLYHLYVSKKNRGKKWLRDL